MEKFHRRLLLSGIITGKSKLSCKNFTTWRQSCCKFLLLCQHKLKYRSIRASSIVPFQMELSYNLTTYSANSYCIQVFVLNYYRWCTSGKIQKNSDTQNIYSANLLNNLESGIMKFNKNPYAQNIYGQYFRNKYRTGKCDAYSHTSKYYTRNSVGGLSNCYVQIFTKLAGYTRFSPFDGSPNSQIRMFSTTSRSFPDTHTVKFIQLNTEISGEHLTPEILLHLITPTCPLWRSRGDECPVPDPFWAFYWPGGQALTRYILDHPWFVRGRRVLDVGSGCGASAIAASLCGAADVLASDTCSVAASAIMMNAKLNSISIDVTTDNLIGHPCSDFDIILLGDMFYDDTFTAILGKWIDSLNDAKKTVAIGDPGRIPFLQHPLKQKLQLLREYKLPEQAMQENSGMTSGYVWACQ